MATSRPFVHGLTKSGIDIYIGGQAHLISLTHPMMSALSIIKAKYFLLFGDISIFAINIFLYEKKKMFAWHGVRELS